MRKRTLSPTVSDQEIPSPETQALAKQVTTKKPAVAEKSVAKIKKYVFVLLLPVIIVAITFVTGIVFMANGNPSQGSTMMSFAVAALLVTTTGYIILPSYLVAVFAYIGIVKIRHTDPLKTMWLIPVVQSLFIWYPSYIKMPDEGKTIGVFFSLVSITLVASLIWIGIVRLGIKTWRKMKQRKLQKI